MHVWSQFLLKSNNGWPNRRHWYTSLTCGLANPTGYSGIQCSMCDPICYWSALVPIHVGCWSPRSASLFYYTLNHLTALTNPIMYTYHIYGEWSALSLLQLQNTIIFNRKLHHFQQQTIISFNNKSPSVSTTNHHHFQQQNTISFNITTPSFSTIKPISSDTLALIFFHKFYFPHQVTKYLHSCTITPVLSLLRLIAFIKEINYNYSGEHQFVSIIYHSLD